MPSGITGIKKEEYRRRVIFNYILGCIKISHKQKTSKIRKNVTKSAFVRRCDTFFDAILRLKQGRNVRKIVSKDTFALSDRLQGVKYAGQGAN